MKPHVLVSQCLLGVRCRYDGKSAAHEDVCRAAATRGWIPVCPEILGGLTTPRCPAERCGSRIVNRDGCDVTEAFQRGAEETLRIAALYGARYALLKERSPSCGAGQIYDGTFSGVRIPGNGLTAERLQAAGIEVFGESRLNDLLTLLDESAASTNTTEQDDTGHDPL